MYYLQSRYYDAKICRFINADSSAYSTLIGYNLFSYCENNPVIRSDSSGKFWFFDDIDYDEVSLEGAGSGCGGGYYYGYGTSYYNYAVYSRTASYDSFYGGYYYSSSSFGGYTASFTIGHVSVTDGMVKNNSGAGELKSKPITNLSIIDNKKFTADQDTVLQLAKEYKKTGMTLSDASILWQWANEYGLRGTRYHGPVYDRYMNGTQLHIKINGMHINVYLQ